MGLLPLTQVLGRLELSRTDSKAALFSDLLNLGEAFLKTYTAAIVAGVADDSNRHRYRLCHKLVRAAGIGEWDEVLADVATGPASQYLQPGAKKIQEELSQRSGKGTWQYESVLTLHQCLAELLPSLEPLPTKLDGRRWFSLFVLLRNKVKHGEPTIETKVKIIYNLERSIRRFMEYSLVPKLEWVFMKRTLSGKYHVAGMSGSTSSFNRFKSDRTSNLVDGIYVDLGAPCRVELVESTIDLTDFYYPNGHFRKRDCEWISYYSGARKTVDGTAYLAPATPLPPSGTEGLRSLDILGRCFANLPPEPIDYVSREELETELTSLLSDDRHPIVSLTGRGGIGKTSLALRVLHRQAHSKEDRFTGIVWLSARDIDLLPEGPKLVKPSVLTIKDVASAFVNLFQPKGWGEPIFDSEKYLAESLRQSSEGPLLFVFDNFETVQRPIDIFSWLDTHVRSPNKILITTRHRDFRGDYYLEVRGMNEQQSDELVRKTAASLGFGKSVTPQFSKDVFKESEGHPYVVKILVGESIKGGSVQKVERIVAGRDELLDALFERTFSRLSPAAKRVFLTLCNWRSLVPRVALEAALMRNTSEERVDVLMALDELRQVSFLDEHISPADSQSFYSVPAVSAAFGKRKLSVSSDHIEIDSDTKFMQLFGAMQPVDLAKGLEPRVQRFFGTLSEELAKGKLNLPSNMPVIELIARTHPRAWLTVSELWHESGQPGALGKVKDCLVRYLETNPSPSEQKIAWDRIANIERQQNNWSEFVNAQVHIAELPNSDLSIISSVVNTFNSVTKKLGTSAETRRTFAKRLAAVMEPKLGEADATDCSRLAWLLIQSGNVPGAMQIIDKGLAMDSENEHCLKLKYRLAWADDN